MGMFSWLTNDTGESVTNRYAEEGALPVYMHDDKGNVWHEPDYEGYGKFGGKDYHELLAEMNGLNTRIEGIGIEYEYFIVSKYSPIRRVPTRSKDILFPNITQEKDWNWVNKPLKNCPDQGYFY